MASFDSSSSSSDGHPVAPATSSQIQGISIRHHVPVILEMDEGNYGQWRHFFESALEKFGLERHVLSTTPDDERDGEWHRIDSCVNNWILATVSKGVFDVVRRNHHDAFSLWNAIEGVFQDNELQHAVYLEHELRTTMQGDLSITAYCAKLKRLADQLSDIGHPVSEPSQLLNLLHGLNPRYHYVKLVITSKSPHTFQSARSFLLLEELSVQHDVAAEATQALTVTHGDQSGGASSGTKDASSSSSAPHRDNHTNNGNGNPRSNNCFNSRRGRNNGTGTGGGGGGGSCSSNNTNQPPGQWTPGYNPWQGLVQAWSMPFRVPGAGVLGPCPPFQPQQAMAALHQPSPPPCNVFDNSALYAALHSVGNQQPPQSASDWYFDTDASSHMSTSSGPSHQGGDSPM